MRGLRVITAFLIVALAAAALVAGEKKGDQDFNPETILLSHFSFKRPSNWQWQHTEKGKGNVLMEITFHIADPQDDNRHGVVLMNQFPPKIDYADAETVAKRWKTWFSDVQQLPTQEIKVGEHKVTYVEFIGSYYGPGKKTHPSPNYRLYGVVVDDDGGNIVGRFFGPEKLVAKYKADFKKMVEDAVATD